MVGIGRGNADRTIDVGRGILRSGGFGPLNAPFNVPDRLEILADANTIARTQCILEARELLCDRIKKTRAFAEGGAPLGSAADRSGESSISSGKSIRARRRLDS